MRQDRIVPFAMKDIALQTNGCPHLGANSLSGRIGLQVQGRLYTQSRRRGGVPNQLDDHLIAHQWFAPPIHRNKGKEPMLNLIQFARARGQMAHRQRQSRLIRTDQQVRGIRVRACPRRRHKVRSIATEKAAVS